MNSFQIGRGTLVRGVDRKPDKTALRGWGLSQIGRGLQRFSGDFSPKIGLVTAITRKNGGFSGSPLFKGINRRFKRVDFRPLEIGIFYNRGEYYG